METYILKTLACMALFLVFYKLVLEKESMHTLKRFYLLGAIIASLLIPRIVFIEYIEAAIPTISEIYIPQNNTVLPTETIKKNTEINTSLLLGILYITGVLLFGFRYCRNLSLILKRIKNNKKLQKGTVFYALLKEDVTPHTFFRYIFLNKQKFETNAIPKEVLIHEETHAKEQHSIDVLFIELLQVFMWFNPLIYFYNKTIKLNHEFLADSAVLKKDVKTSVYQNTLLSYLSPDSKQGDSPKLANAINYSSIKKRFTIMKTQTSKKSVLLRSLLIIPLLALLLYSFTEKKIVEQQTTDTSDITQEGATKEDIVEYNTLAKKYTKIVQSNRIIIKKKEVDRMAYLYSTMNDKQRKNAESYPTIPPMPEPTNTPEVKHGEVSNIPPPPSLNSKTESKQNGWVVSSGANRNSRQDKEGMHLPPVTPTIVMHANKDGYSAKLKTSIQKYLTKNEPYEEAISAYSKKGKGNLQELWNTYNKAMKLYVEYYNLAQKEGNFIEPMHNSTNILVAQENKTQSYVKATSIDFIKNSPPTPPTPPTPLDHVIAMAKKGADFYYEGKKITSDRAIELVKSNTDLNIDSRSSKTNKPTVRISTKPISIK